MLSELRMRTKMADEHMLELEGHKLTDDDYDVVLSGPVRVLKEDGRPLCVYRPRAIPPELREVAWPILHGLKGGYTTNRGMAAGSERYQGPSQRSYAMSVDSQVLGSFRGQGPRTFCRLTAWTGAETEQWRGLWPFFQCISDEMQEHVPQRFAAQMAEINKTEPEWVISGTPFTTITVNNTYSTAVHRDKGDLDAGFSTLVVFREGDYKGGLLVMPQYRVAVDMQDSDLLLMDAHDWHGNTPLDPEPERRSGGQLAEDPGYERISVVSYMRADLTKCGSAKDEFERGEILTENRYKALVGE